MTELASTGQLRAAFMRWALFLVPGVLLLGFLSVQAAGSGPNSPWFAALVKPSLYPPEPVFGLVWSFLYVLMGFALAMIASARGARGRIVAIAAFAIQLALNLMWTPTFFGAHQMSSALWIACGLVVALLVTLVLFIRIRPVAGWLLAPCLAWVLFVAAQLAVHRGQSRRAGRPGAGRRRAGRDLGLARRVIAAH